MRYSSLFILPVLLLFGCQSQSPVQLPQTGQPGIVNAEATPETIALFRYLRDQTADKVLFGHQYETTQGLTIQTRDGTESDTLHAVGDFAAVYGWDTLNFVRPSRDVAIDIHVRKAFQRGGINTVSTHFNNPVTEDQMTTDNYPVGQSWDRTPAVAASLPGGEANARYRRYLDDVARWAKDQVASDGTPIPILFRILHENTGSWFWWGADHCTPDEYKALYRYTVDYLTRDQDVRNFLFVYSPNAFADPTKELYLNRYPGDAWVDVLAFDHYGPAEDNAEFFWQVAANAALVSRMAQERGKVAAIAEIGISGPDIKTGKTDPDWFRKLLHAIKDDPDARKVAYLLVWRNGGPTHYWVPTSRKEDITNGTLEDFRAFYNDPFSAFNKDIGDVYK